MQTFIQAMSKHFKGDNAASFRTDYAKLTAEDKRDLYHGLVKLENGDCDVPSDKNGPIDISSNPNSY